MQKSTKKTLLSKQKQSDWIQLKQIKQKNQQVDKKLGHYTRLEQEQSYIEKDQQINTKLTLQYQNKQINNNLINYQQQYRNNAPNTNFAHINQNKFKQMNKNNNPYQNNRLINNQTVSNNQNQKSSTFRKSIPDMQVNCDKCTFSQTVPGNVQMYICCICNQMSQCYPLYGVFTCGICYINVIYPYNTSQFIKCTRCYTVNKVPLEPKKQIKQTQISMGKQIQDDLQYEVVQKKLDKLQINEKINKVKQLYSNEQVQKQFKKLQLQYGKKQTQPIEIKLDLQQKNKLQQQQELEQREKVQNKKFESGIWEEFDNKMNKKQNEEKQILFNKNNQIKKNQIDFWDFENKKNFNQKKQQTKIEYPSFFD